MKTNFKLTLVLLVGVVFVYTGCKKSSSPTPKTVNNPAVSQIAMNFYQSLVGSYGGVSVSNGLSSPSFVNPSKSLQLNGTSTCGFYIDNGIDYHTNIGDTIKSHSTGSISFYFLCNNNTHVGFNNIDSLHTEGTAPGYAFIYDFTQNYLVKSLNPQNTSISVDGTIKSFIDYNYTKPGKKNLSIHNRYKLDGLEVNINDNSNVTQGTVTFTSFGTSDTVSWDYEGTITFYGDHKAILVVNGLTYKVDLKTGIITT